MKAQRLRLLGVLFVLLLIGCVGLYTAYYLRASCDELAVEKASHFLLGQRDRFDHAYQFAVTASPTSLDRPVGTLQLIVQAVKEAEVPVCMQTAREELTSYMGTVIRAFQAFGAAESDSTIQKLIHQSEVHHANFKRELEAVRKCAPFCLP